MAPNVAELADPSKVGDFEAEASMATKRSKKLVSLSTLTMKADLPEKGTWHQERKKAIMQKHPEVKALFGKNPWSALIMACGVLGQTFLAIFLAHSSWFLILPVSYTLGAYLAWVTLAMAHESSHGLVFSSKFLNKLHTQIAFVPSFFGPFGAFWGIEHMYHHQVIVDKMNRYGPQDGPLFAKLLTALFFTHAINLFFLLTSLVAGAKALVHHGLYLIGREKNPYPPGFKEPPFRNFPQVVNSPYFFLNFALAVGYHSWLYLNYGIRPVIFLMLSTSWANGLHPLGMRQVQEHYLQRKGQPTNSVYSPLSPLLLNMGYHVEHHDFPTIPWNRLPRVTALAPEFYLPLFSYSSYTQVFVDFLTTPGIPYSSLLEEEDWAVEPKK